MKRTLLFSLSLLFGIFLSSQSTSIDLSNFRITGDAVKTGDQCIRMTKAQEWQGGAIWSKTPIDLNAPFSMEIDLMFGCSDAGADGIVFIFHPKLKLGFPGEGMGFGGLYPSFGVEMDTYENRHLSDPFFDHIALMKHGRLHHERGLIPPVPILPNHQNIEDCRPHRFKIEWEAGEKTLKVIVDGSTRINYKYDLVQNIFHDNSIVYWGFSSATGGMYNKHEICLKKLEFTEVGFFDEKTETELLEGKRHTLEQVKFASGQTSINRLSANELNKLVMLLKKKPHLSVYIDGHTDSSGSDQQNKTISKRRAEAVAQYLFEKGISKDRIFSSGHGERYPIESNATPLGRKKNRRIDIYLMDPRA